MPAAAWLGGQVMAGLVGTNTERKPGLCQNASFHDPLLPSGLLALVLQQDTPKSYPTEAEEHHALMTHGSPVAGFPLQHNVQDQIHKEHP